MNISIDPRLSEAARLGNVDALYALIHEDPYMKLNPDGFSPMHSALRNGQIKLVLRLLKADKDLVRVKGREGMTPLHCVVTMGNSNMLIDFLEACPECIEDVTVLNETALHLALKNDQIEAFNLLIGWLLRNRRKGAFALEQKVVNWRENDDNTALHIAAKKELRQELQLLLKSFFPSRIDIKAKNSEGLTALEIIQNVQRQATNSAEDDITTKIKRFKKKVNIFEETSIGPTRARTNLSGEMHNATLVVTALVITFITCFPSVCCRVY
ncbi:hypothetical protein J1N35_029599 [Gossypium stocksii]|uniref:PGG domain-containing protein n=1 Tax=Gossypium stocksii TaxID=47602 RepID=A0A9D3ZTD5_9ROSI|nr:hypothetical protein J1N35_029599 [Gossypium stocksii]